MPKRLLVLLLLLLTLSISACGLLQEPEEASAPIEAIPLEVENPEGEAAPAEPTEAATEPAQPAATAAPTAEPTEQAVAEPTVEPTAEPAVEAASTEEPQAEEAAANGSGLRVFQISQNGSEVRFELDEDLRGVRTTVVGVTNQVAGELAVDLADLAQTQVGVLQINARTLLTDNNFRNRAIQNEILQTGPFEFITFAPTAVTGLPAAAAVGEPLTFAIEGDLTIRDITAPATFTVTAMADSPDQISGTASTTVSRELFDLRIPDVPGVANVEDEVDLFIDFIAGTG